MFPTSGAISAAPSYYQYWSIFDGWDASVNKIDYRCDSSVIDFTINSVIVTEEDRIRSRLPRGGGGGGYGNNMISQKISLDVSSDPNEWSHSWAMMK